MQEEIVALLESIAGQDWVERIVERATENGLVIDSPQVYANQVLVNTARRIESRINDFKPSKDRTLKSVGIELSRETQEKADNIRKGLSLLPPPEKPHEIGYFDSQLTMAWCLDGIAQQQLVGFSRSRGKETRLYMFATIASAWRNVAGTPIPKRQRQDDGVGKFPEFLRSLFEVGGSKLAGINIDNAHKEILAIEKEFSNNA